MKENIRLLAFFFTLVLFLSSYGQNAFPDKIRVAKSDTLTRVKGTRYFAKIPENYKPIKNLVRYQKNDSTYFQIVQVPDANFQEFKSKTSKQELLSKGVKVYVYEPVDFNGLDGIYSEGSSKFPGEIKIIFSFGDKTFVTMVVAVCKAEDKDSKEEMKKIFSHSYYDTSYQLDPFELANFELDKTISGFKYATTIGNIFFFTPSGKADMKSLLDFSCYQVATLEAGSFDNVIELLTSMNSNFGSQGVRTSNLKETEITINGNRAVELTMDAQDRQNRKGKFYEFLLFNESSGTGIIFIGCDVDNGQYMEKFKATAKSIKLL